MSMPMPFASARRAQRRQAGFSLVELMIGSALGLLVVAAATRFTLDQLQHQRRHLLQARLEQDLRTVTDMIVRDLRRAGYRQDSLAGTGPAASPNPHAAITTGSGAAVRYSLSRPTDDGDGSASQQAGWRLARGGIDTLLGGRWQSVTDPKVLRVQTLSIEPSLHCVSLSHQCAAPGLADSCTPAGAAYPRLWVRHYALSVRASAAQDPTLQRELQASVRVRNDAIESPQGCPA